MTGLFLWLSGVAVACDGPQLQTLSAELSSAETPPAASELGPRLARACPRPLALNAALQAGGEPIADRDAAVRQAGQWNRLCGGIDSIPSGLETITPGQRMALWTDCQLEGTAAFEAHEWIATTGPAVSVVVLAAQLATVESLTASQRRTLVRAWAGLPNTEVEVPDELRLPTTPTATPTIVTLATIRWPPPPDPDLEPAPDETTCLVDIDVLDDGAPNTIRWVRCPEAMQALVRSALGGSWFEPARSSGRTTPGTLRLRFERGQPSGVPVLPDAR